MTETLELGNDFLPYSVISNIIYLIWKYTKYEKYVKDFIETSSK